MTEVAHKRVHRQHKRVGWIQSNSTKGHRPRSTTHPSTASGRTGFPHLFADSCLSKLERRELQLNAGQGQSLSCRAPCRMAHRTRCRCSDLPPRTNQCRSLSSLQSNRTQAGTFVSTAPSTRGCAHRHKLWEDSMVPTGQMRLPGRHRNHL